jgi:hypothetical protein
VFVSRGNESAFACHSLKILDADICEREKTVDKPDSGLRPIKQFRAFHASLQETSTW